MPKSFRKSAHANNCFICFIAAISVIIVLSSCRHNSRPRLRPGSFFGNPWGMRYDDPNALGPHCLDNCSDEQLGLIYTYRGGFIDIGHLREAADRTYYITKVTYDNLMHSKSDFSYRVIEPSRYYISLDYPDHWDGLSQQEKEGAAREISIQLGQYLAHTSLIWHEILTWYGFSSTGIFSENISAFSIEDPYSDVLGTHLAAHVLSDPNAFYKDTVYEKAMTSIIDETLNELEAQSIETTKHALETIKGDWYKGGYYFFVEMKKRNLDVGLDDGTVTPWLIPAICPDAVPRDCPAPNTDFLDKYSFEVKVRLKPLEFQKRAICKTLGLERSDRITPGIHFPIIIENIREEARRIEGDHVDISNLEEIALEKNEQNSNSGCEECP